MRRVLATALVLSLAGSAGSAPDSSAPPRAVAPPGGAVLAFVFDGSGRLAALDARTLAPHRNVVVGYPAGAHAVSVDRTRIVLGSGAGAPRITIVDLRRMRSVARVELRGAGHVQAIAWLGERRLGVLVRHRNSRLLVVDVTARRVVSTRAVTADVVASAATEGALAVLVAPRRWIGPARLLVLGRDGATRTARLELEAGWDKRGQTLPGLALDASGRRAVIVAAGRAAEVDLRTLAVAEHELVRSASLLGRLRDWLEPRAHAKGHPGSVRSAFFVDRHRIAVTGFHSGGEWPQTIGVEVLDARNWRVRTVAADAIGAVTAAGAFVAFSSTEDGVDVRVLEPSGEERHRLTVAGASADVQAAGRYAYLPDDRSMRWQVLDLESGRVVGTGRTAGTAVIVEPAS
jgi:hypothetical protein